ncbi:MAG TPA: tRNA pseudouridine(38-40) synthase TruA [Desulfotomaculum sp.]|nr:MAG: tRNA pseudouridine synthase A [Desulfotomaculum sp. 46_80]KUK85323.1 MAG: tRNA pseudouridine synthase A [Desulfofundulus kuznetsovii]HAG10579.1 tRNA pseudouridine(38-40) synthase TruA [Desulfotomaculum sp.]HBY03470.1 tRNA pseudouridine(38-40) synthase TruA [Desulfotomaculum sp.]
MRNIKLTVAYDGTNYHGFQKQYNTGLPTIQEVIENSLFRLAKREIKVTGAARTDAGVHARGQVINFDASNWSIPADRAALALNGALPRDIVIMGSEQVDPDFHARYSALSKTYFYILYNDIKPSPFWRLYSCFMPRSLDISAMKSAAKALEGENDFAAFQASGSAVKSTVRTLFRTDVRKKGKFVYLTFKGNGFLYNMVRIMVGTLLEIGQGKRLPEETEQILTSRNREMAGFTAPACGLYLKLVEY